MNILIVGLGSIAKKHIYALKQLSLDVKLYALRNSKEADQYEDVINIFNLDDTLIIFDFAIISNPTHLHSQYIELLNKKNIPLFIEKPAIHNLENADYLSDQIIKNNLTTYVACNLRFHPCLVFLKKKLEENKLRINELNVYCGSFLPDWRPGRNFREIYSSKPEMGGGVHLDLFHELDYVNWLFGFPQRSHSLTRKVSSLNIEAIDYANYTLEYEYFTAAITLNYYRRKPKRQIEIVFNTTTWVVDLITNIVTDDNENVLFEAKEFTILETYKSQLDYFIDCLKTNTKPMNSFIESVNILKISLGNGK